MSKFSIVLPFVRSPYNYDTMAASDEAGLFCSDPSLAIQSAAAECDINTILANMARGVMPDNTRLPQYGDFTSTANDYHNALNTVIAAQEAFDLLPASTRARFANDPENLLDFLHDRNNLQEAIDLGLVPSPPEGLTSPVEPPIQRSSATGDGKPAQKSNASVPASNESEGD